MRLIDLTGKVFGRLTALEKTSPFGSKKPTWRCRCACGAFIETTGERLRIGDTRSCGCLHREQAAQFCRDRETTHGGSRSRIYRIWVHMIDRCQRPTHHAAKWYFSKGIRVCEQWKDFSAFRAWAMSNGYQEDLSIDRVDSNAGYCPENCEWVTLSVNSQRRHAAQRQKREAAHAV